MTSAKDQCVHQTKKGLIGCCMNLKSMVLERHKLVAERPKGSCLLGVFLFLFFLLLLFLFSFFFFFEMGETRI